MVEILGVREITGTAPVGTGLEKMVHVDCGTDSERELHIRLGGESAERRGVHV